MTTPNQPPRPRLPVLAKTNDPDPATILVPPREPERIYINPHWHVTVDRAGYVIGLWFEGAFGCVIPMVRNASISHPNLGDFLALKIPRLLADTIRENEFIRQIVESEAKLVAEANRGEGPNSGLIPTQEIAHDLLRGIRQLRGVEDAAISAQDGCILLFSFRKGKPPRIVSVKHENGALVVFPPGAAESVKFVTAEVWAELADPNEARKCSPDRLHREFREPYYFELSANTRSSGVMNHGPMPWTLSTELEPSVWYSALPSIIYKWAQGTLQQAVSQRDHLGWRLADHYDLHIRIARGVATLHSKQLIHGDLRPANIMMLGKRGSACRAADYAVGDYGSFSSDRSRNGPPNPNGHTMTGAGVSRHRTSMFYAPERRHGYERENADVAVVINRGGTEEYLMICLGWGSVLFDGGTTRLRDDLRGFLEDSWKDLHARVNDPGSAGMHELPRDGDRLRLRDYVFEVSASKTTPFMSLFLVKRRFAQVLHERVAVYSRDDETLVNGSVITLPMYTEIHQWSAATDLYGVGTLALYTLFMSAVQREYSEAAFDESVHSRFESMAAELIGRLSSIPDAVEIWGDLDLFWTAAETWAADEHAPERQQVEGAEISMAAFALKTTNNLLRIKSMKFLLDCFRADMVAPRNGQPLSHDDANRETSYNLAHFLFFVHFLISCLHRRQALQAVNDRGLNFDHILCSDRCEKPCQTDGTNAADLALQRLETLQQRVSSPIYRGFIVMHSSLDFEYRAETEFRLQLQRNNLLNDKKQLERHLDLQKQAVTKFIDLTKDHVDAFSLRPFRFFQVDRFVRRLLRLLDSGHTAVDIRMHTLPMTSSNRGEI